MWQPARMTPLVSAALVAAGLSSRVAVAGVWEDEIPITQDPLPQFRSYITTVPDDTAYALWPDWTDFEDVKVNLIRSEDQGHTWTPPHVIFEGAAYENFQLLADAAGLHLLLVEFTEDDENEYKHLYYTRSDDDGVTFSEPVRVGERDNVEAIKLFSDTGKLYIYAFNIVFALKGDLFEHYLYVSSDNGATWDEKQIMPGTAIANPDFAVRDGNIHMVYGGDLFSNPGIAYSVTADEGDTWSVPVLASQGAGPHAQLPQIALDDTAIHVAWEDDRGGFFEIMYSRSLDGGLTFGPDVQINDTAYGARNDLLADEEGLHIVWCQYHGDDGWPDSWGSFDYGIIWYKFSDDSGATWSDEFRVSQNESIPPIDLPDLGANLVKLAEYGDGFCAMWQDKRDGNVDLYLRNHFTGVSSECLTDISQEVVCHGDGTTFTVNVEGVNVCTGDTMQFSFTGSGGAVGEEMCFTVLVNAGGGFCCSTQICVTLPDCSANVDVNGDGIVGIFDFLTVLNTWGACLDCGTQGACPADFDGDCEIGVADVLILMANWD
ncbi:MAG: sialidase family protein [Planctomycetota bacterium]